MIKLLNDSLPPFILNGGYDVIKTRIICYADCYGFDKSFIDFWAGDNVVIARFDFNFTVWADEDADFEELKEFLDVIGAVDIVTFENVALKLGYNMHSIKQSFEFKGEAVSASEVSAISEETMRDAYSLVAESIEGSFNNDKDSYLAFLSDFKYRENRGYARGVCIVKNSVAAVGFTASETDNSAVLSGIACDKECRKSGYGKAIIYSLAAALQSEGKSVFVIALNDSAIGFYEHIGFKRKEKIAYILR